MTRNLELVFNDTQKRGIVVKRFCQCSADRLLNSVDLSKISKLARLDRELYRRLCYRDIGTDLDRLRSIGGTDSN